MVGYEMLANPQRDITAETSARNAKKSCRRRTTSLRNPGHVEFLLREIALVFLIVDYLQLNSKRLDHYSLPVTHDDGKSIRCACLVFSVLCN